MENSFKNRKKNRLPNYDYASSGCYFITICTKDMQNIFGEIPVKNPDPDARLLENTPIIQFNEYGNIVKDTWLDLPNHNSNLDLDIFTVMPNHFHAIVFLSDELGTNNHSLSEIIRQFKTFSSKRINEKRGITSGIWQRSFYDEIIQNEMHYQRAWLYIENNPNKWRYDKYFQE